jgi:hypothetical protein
VRRSYREDDTSTLEVIVLCLRCLEIPKNRELIMLECRSAQIYKALKDVDEAIDGRGCGVSAGE